MTDDQTPAPEAGDEVVQTEVEQTPAPEAAESTEGQDTDQPAEVSDDTEEKSKSAQRRERRKAYQQQLEKEAEEAKRAEEEIKSQLAAKREAAQKLKKPEQGDYQDFEEYQAAMSAYHMLVAQDGRELAQLEAAEAARVEQVQRVTQQRHMEARQNWESQVADASQKYPDFEQVAMNESLPISQAMAEMIMTSDDAAELAYSLGRQPDLVSQIARMDPINMARAIGQVEARLSAQNSPATKAPPPITPVKGAAVSNDPAKMTPAQYREWRLKGGTYK